MSVEQARPQLQSRPLSFEEQNYYGSLIDKLVEARKAQRLSQAALDDRIGVSEGMVAKWESKMRLPGAFFLMCWCSSLDVRLTITEG